MTVARALIGGFGLLLLLAGFGVAAIGGDVFSALSMFVSGVVIVAGVLLERTRYRSLHAEQTGARHGPGGGETESPSGGFVPTQERFVDPSTNVPMQVWIDPGTGERRYVPLR